LQKIGLKQPTTEIQITRTPPPPPPPTTTTFYGKPPEDQRKKKKGKLRIRVPSIALKRSPIGIIPDYLSEMKSQLRFGSATAVSPRKSPGIFKYGKNLIGYTPTREQFKAGEAKSPFGKSRGFKLGKY
jgi:hypothetical protein